MNRIYKRTGLLYVLAIAFIVGLAILFASFGINAKKWVMQPYNQHIYSQGNLTGMGAIYDRNGKVLAQTANGKRSYNQSRDVRLATLHVVGDAEGYISTGAQTIFKSKLTGYNRLNGLYMSDEEARAHDITLSIDADLSVAAMKAMGSYQGTIGVYNYKTGEILCAVSCPTYDVENKPEIDTEKEQWDAVYMNRFFSGSYTPGSTFKVITTASALENCPGIESDTFHCNGYYTNPQGSKVKCNSTHGTVTFTQGLNRSCNVVFAKVAGERLSNDELQSTAESFGFNDNVEVDGIKCKASTIDLKNAYAIDRSWAGIGQYTTLVNPCHEITVMGAIANRNGTTPKPTILRQNFSKSSLKYITSYRARQLDDLLRSNVTNYYRDSKFPNLQMCGKTGTAQVSNGAPHTWFVGYSQRPDLPYAIVVVLENSGGYGLTNAIPIANTVMQKALSLSQAEGK